MFLHQIWNLWVQARRASVRFQRQRAILVFLASLFMFVFCATFAFATPAPNLNSVSVQTGLTVNVVFSENMGTGVTTPGNYTISGTGRGTLGANPASVALVSGKTYRLTWTSGEMFNGGDITITATAANIFGADGKPLNSTNNSKTDTGGAIGTLPSVTVNQGAAQADPANALPVVFAVVFSEPVADFTVGDVTLTGTAATGATFNVSGSGATFQINVTALTTPGTLIPSLAAGVAHDAAGNPSLASSSTDHTVTFNPVKNVTRSLFYSTLQAAINAATAGDTVEAGAWAYTENVTLGKALTLRTAAGAAATILNGGFRVTASNVHVSGFTVNGGHDFGSGVAALQVDASSSHSLENNTLAGTGAVGSRGVLCAASSTNVYLTGNDIRNWASGVSLTSTTYVYLQYNNIHQNTNGVDSNYLSYAYLRGNLFDSNSQAGWRAQNQGRYATAELNSFLANGAGILSVSGAVVDGRNNWWNNIGGPGGGVSDPVTGRLASGSGNIVGSNVRFDPWLSGPNPTLSVTAPAAGATVQKGLTQTVTWTSSQVAGNVKLFYSLTGAAPWTQIALDQPNTGSFSWLVTTPLSTTARLRVTAMNCNNIYGESGLFTIANSPSTPSITVSAPAVGASCPRGSVQAIRWSSNALSGNVKIFASVDGGPWTLIVLNTPNDGAFDWLVTQNPSTNVKIRVTSMGSNALYGESGVFQVASGGTITVTAPVAGAIVTRGSTQIVHWSSSGLSGNVKLFVSSNGGSWLPIGYDVPNSGSFSWVVRTPATANARIRVTSMLNNALYGETGVFQIQ